MVTVEVSAKLTVDDLLVAVEQLPAQELTDFVRRLIALQTRRGLPLVVDEEERALLQAIEGHLPAKTQRRLDTLRDKSREGTLTSTEQAELLSFVQQVEHQDLARAEALINLARQRGVTISTLLHQLGLEPAHA